MQGVRIDAAKAFYYQLSASGFDREVSKDIVRNHIEVVREYRDENNKPVSSAKIGSKLRAVLRIKSLDGKAIKNIAIVDLLPGAFEVDLNDPALRAASDASTVESGKIAESGGNVAATRMEKLIPSYVDVREDRVLIFAEVDPSPKEFSYGINLTNKGSFSVPAIYAESMYDKTVQASSPGGSFVINE